MRIFVAIDLPREVRESLSSLQALLRDRLRGIRWVRPQGVHLTLRFIGEVDDAGLQRLRSSLSEAIPGASPPFDLRLHGIGTFPGKTRPRVLWVSVEQDGGSLDAVQGTVEAAAREAGFAEETRPFRAHLTLGRFKGRSGGELDSVLEELRDTRHGSFTVSSVTLFQSLLKPTGAEYRRVEDYPLMETRERERL